MNSKAVPSSRVEGFQWISAAGHLLKQINNYLMTVDQDDQDNQDDKLHLFSLRIESLSAALLPLINPEFGNQRLLDMLKRISQSGPIVDPFEEYSYVYKSLYGLYVLARSRGANVPTTGVVSIADKSVETDVPRISLNLSTDGVVSIADKSVETVMKMMYQEYLSVSKTSDWKDFWDRWYGSNFAKDKGDWGVGPQRAWIFDGDQKQCVRDLEIFYKYRTALA